MYIMLLTACHKVIERAQRAPQRHLADGWLDVAVTPCRPYQSPTANDCRRHRWRQTINNRLSKAANVQIKIQIRPSNSMTASSVVTAHVSGLVGA